MGVDTLMAAMCLLTVWLSLRVMEQPTVARAALAGLAAGLAVSSKYNAAPVVLVPVLAVFLSGRWRRVLWRRRSACPSSVSWPARPMQ